MIEQETDSKLTSVLPSDLVEPLELKAADETGGDIYGQYSPLIGKPDILGDARRALRQINDQPIAERFAPFLTTIQELLLQLQQRGFDLQSMPRLHAHLPNDGSVVLEWILNDYRLGFTIEQDTNDSGWYLVSNRRMGEIMASGALTQVDREVIDSWLHFILGNS